jgi:ABC-2 type transport system ATP-binding protein
MSDAVEIEDLVRLFQFNRRPSRGNQASAIRALDGVSMMVRRGEILGLLGPNGAGKTTLVKILSTMLLPTSGSVRVLGFDVTKEPRRVQERIGIVLGGERGFYGRLTVRQNLDYWSAMYQLPRRARRARIAELLDQLGLADRADSPVDRLSRGMKQRVHLARGFLGDPELVFLDEPTSGMDPVAARDFRRLLTDLRGNGRTILLATHDMSEAEAVCDRVALIDRGRIRGIEDPKEVGRWLTAYERVDARGVLPELLLRIRHLPGTGAVEDLGDGWLRVQTTSAGAAHAILELLIGAGITSVRTSLPSLEDVYLNLIGDRGLSV